MRDSIDVGSFSYSRWQIVASVVLVLGLAASLIVDGDSQADAINPADVDTVYVADGTDFADALMGATLAASNNSPMLGVAPHTLPGETVRELERLTNNRRDLLDTIYIFGGPAAVSDEVASDLGNWATNVQRIQGENRWGTYEAISQALPGAVAQADDADTLDGLDSTELATEVKRVRETFPPPAQANNWTSITVMCPEGTLPVSGSLQASDVSRWDQVLSANGPSPTEEERDWYMILTWDPNRGFQEGLEGVVTCIG